MNIYNAVPGNVSLASAVQVSVPADGVDSMAVTTVNTGLQKEADYLEAIRNLLVGSTSAFYALLTFSGFFSISQGSSIYLFNAGNTVGNPTPVLASAEIVSQNDYVVPIAGKLRTLAVKSSSTTPSGVSATTVITVRVNGVNTTLTLSIAGGNNGVNGYYTVTIPAGITVNAGDFVSISFTYSVVNGQTFANTCASVTLSPS